MGENVDYGTRAQMCSDDPAPAGSGPPIEPGRGGGEDAAGCAGFDSKSQDGRAAEIVTNHCAMLSSIPRQTPIGKRIDRMVLPV